MTGISDQSSTLKPPRITSATREGLTGQTERGVTVLATNLSRLPALKSSVSETRIVGRANDVGEFEGVKLAGVRELRPGDVVRVWAQRTDGTQSAPIDVRVKGVDTDNASLAIDRINLVKHGQGVFHVENLERDIGRPISEPHAKVKFTNSRTGETVVTVLDANGTFVPNLTLKANPGDFFSVAVSDGTNDVTLGDSAGFLMAPHPVKPGADVVAPRKFHASKYGVAVFTGPLFGEKGPLASDVRQGKISNCYFASSVAAIAKAMPGVIRNMVKKVGPTKYEVTFKERNPETGVITDVVVPVTSELWARPSGLPLYGHSAASTPQQTMVLWYALVEKAYARYCGGYEQLADGVGTASQVFEAFTGLPAHSVSLSTRPGDLDSHWQRIADSIKQQRPLTFGTSSRASELVNSGVYSKHGYTLVGCEETPAGRFVDVYNPWGMSAPDGNGPDNGFFRIALSQLPQLFKKMEFIDPTMPWPLNEGE